MATMTHKKPISVPKIALFEPDIPQNTAAIARTCACLGAKLEIIEPCGFLLNDKRFKKVVMDYMNQNEIIIYEIYKKFFNSKKNQRIILMTTKAKKLNLDFNFSKNDTLLFGRESSGVPKKIHKLIKNKLKIPMIETKRSLNLATSVAIVLSENLRQTSYIK